MEDDQQSSNDTANDELRKKLQLSIQLAAKYKEQVINLESNLNYTARFVITNRRNAELGIYRYIHKSNIGL